MTKNKLMPEEVDPPRLIIASAIVDLINSSPRTPTRDEIAGVIDGVLAEAGRYADRDDYDANQVADLTFDALPVTFDETNVEFCNSHLPWVRIAFAAVLEKDDKAAFETVVQMDEELRERLARGIDATHRRMEALGELLGAAGARFLVMRARCKLQAEGATR
jgi:hypothetical protein